MREPIDASQAGVGASWVRYNGIVALRRADSKTSVSGPTRTSRKVRFYAAIGQQARIKRASSERRVMMTRPKPGNPTDSPWNFALEALIDESIEGASAEVSFHVV